MKLSLILLGALALVVLPLRRRSAALRHCVLAAAVACAAAVPLLEAFVPYWSLPVAAPAIFGSPQARAPELPAGAAASGAVAELRIALPAATPAARSRAAWPAGARGLLALAWIAGSLAAAAIMAAGFIRLRWVARRARPVTDPRWIALAAELAHALGLRRPVTLLESAHPPMLVTWGVARPVVLLPPAAAGWSDERARIVLAHEIAHIRRADWLLQVLADALRAAYWFNPLVWIVCRRLRLESEQACDDEVLSRGVSATSYADHLIALARDFGTARACRVPAPAMARHSSLERRVRAMLTQQRDRRPITSSARAAVFTAVLGASLAVAAAQTPFATFSGSIVDPQGKGVGGTAVTLANEARRAKYEVATDPLGGFELVGLPAGEYTVEVRSPGFRPIRDALVVEGKHLQRTYRLELGHVEESIVVWFDPAEAASAPPAAGDGGSSPAPRVREVPRPAPRECVTPITGGHVVPPRKIRDVVPRYPDALRGSGVSGDVLLDTRIGVDGYVSEIAVLGEPHPALADAAVAAVREWRFTETTLNCLPVSVAMTVQLRFEAAPARP